MNRNHLRLILTIVAFLLIQSIYYYNFIQTKGSEFMDTDTFMRMVRVEQLCETGEWFNSKIARSNYPLGETSHWTRLFDIPLTLGGLIGSPVWGLSKALMVSGIMIGPILGIAAVYCLEWSTAIVLSQREKHFLPLLFIAQPVLFEYFRFGRPDHHGLLMLLFIGFIGSGIRTVVSKDPRAPWVTGFILAMSMWVSVETLVSVGLMLLILFLFWIVKGGDYPNRILRFAVSLLGFSTVFLIIERPFPALLESAYDTMTVVHILAFALIALCSSVITMLKGGLSMPGFWRRRAAVAVGMGVAGLIVMRAGYPLFFKGPFATVNPAIVPIWLSRVQEVQPLYGSDLMDLAKMAVFIGLGFLTTFYMMLQSIKGDRDRKPVYCFFAIGLTVYILLSLYQLRWSGYVEILSLLPASILMGRSLERLSVVKPPLIKALLRLLVIAGISIGFVGIGAAVALSVPRSVEEVSSHVYVKPLCQWINAHPELIRKGDTLLGFLNSGPEILYRTQLNVISTPYHRNDQGILYHYQVMRLKSAEEAQKRIQERSVDLILISLESSEKRFLEYQDGDGSLYDQLVSKKPPLWLEEIPLPAELDAYLLYRVVRQP